jgi:hypothetical protein
VDEDERRPLAADEVADAAEPAFLQIRKTPFGLRHALGIIFDVMESFVGRAE